VLTKSRGSGFTLRLMKKLVVLMGLIGVLLSGCVQNIVRSPQFEMREAGLLKLNPPGLNGVAPEAVIRVTLDARNPNPFDLSLEELRFDLYLDGAKLAAGIGSNLAMKANGTPSRFYVDVEIPLSVSSLKSLGRIVAGSSVEYRLDGGFRVDAGPLGKPRFGPYTLAQGRYQSPSIASQPPSFAWRSDLTRLTVGAGGAVLDLAFEVTNPSPIGYRLVAPLNLLVGGQILAKAEAGGVVPAKGKGILSTRFQLDPLAAGRAFIGGRFDFQVSGTPTLEVPGLQNYSFPLSVLFGGSATR
jgi:LEA14-like dessication related protein